MANAPTRADVQFGYGIESTIGTAVAASAGLAVRDPMPAIKAGAKWITDRKSTGLTVPTTDELKAGAHDPAWSPPLTVTHPLAGLLVASCLQNALQTPVSTDFLQTMVPDLTSGKRVLKGTADALGNRALTFWQRIGQSGSRDVNLAGGIVTEIAFNFPETGLVTMTPTIMGTNFDNAADGSAGTYTLPSQSIEKLTSDFKCYIVGLATEALYAKEWSFTLRAQISAPKRYGGWNGLYPFGFVLTDWTVEGQISKPVIVAQDTVAKAHVVDGGDTSSDVLMYVYPAALANYNDALDTDGQMRFTINANFEEPDLDFTDETIETLSFSGRYDATNYPFKMEQYTTDTQAAWAA